MAKLALLIGNDAYQDPRLARLSAPAADVHALQTILKRHDIGVFDDVKLLANAALATALREISALFADKVRDDLLLLYFSGHGVLDRNGHLFLALNDTQSDLLLGTAIPASFIKEVMDQSLSHRQILILDCCYSGAFERGRKGGQTAVTEATFEVKGYGREVLTSSGATQYAFDGEDVHGEAVTSLFTRFLIEGLRTGQAAPGSETISVEQLYHYVHGQVRKTTPQMTPHRWVDNQQGTSLILARNPNPWGMTLPAELVALLEDANPLIRAGAVRVLGSWLVGEDERKQQAAQGKLRQLSAAEKHVDVRDAIDEVLRTAQREEKRRAPNTATAQEKDSGDSGVARTAKQWPSSIALVVALVIAGWVAKQLLLDDASETVQIEEAIRIARERIARQEQEAEVAKRPEAGTIFRDTLKDGSQGPEMVVIPAGSFLMGSPEDEKGRDDDEGPQHEVTMAKDFAMGKYEVTFHEYDKFAAATGRERPEDRGWRRDNRPVISVSWKDAVAYTEWLSEQTGKRYRLPTEAEWEYAGRAGTKTAYWWGDDIRRDRANCYGCGSQWDGKQTAPVGSFEPNSFGLYDTVGNVWEWVRDCWNDSYEGAPTDGSAWLSGDCGQRVVRGGSWDNKPQWMRSADRNWDDPVDRYDLLGFRLAQDL